MGHTISFSIFGKQSPYNVPARVIGRSYAQHYPSKEHKNWQASVLVQALSFKPEEPWPGAVSLSLVFTRVKAKSHPKHPERCKDPRKALLAAEPIIKPDLTKLARIVEDALKGIFWLDDSQVVWQEFRKRWGGEYRTDVRIEFLGAVDVRRSQQP